MSIEIAVVKYLPAKLWSSSSSIYYFSYSNSKLFSKTPKKINIFLIIVVVLSFTIFIRAELNYYFIFSLLHFPPLPMHLTYCGMTSYWD